jgi:DNA-binding YbaB/EbfC family protein
MSNKGMFGGMGNLGNVMKQAQAMQERLAKVQAEVATKTVQASSGGGMVTVTATGGMEIVSVKIDPEVVKANDAEMLQDLVVAATNEALRKAREMVAEEMKGVTGGLQIPGLF